MQSMNARQLLQRAITTHTHSSQDAGLGDGSKQGTYAHEASGTASPSTGEERTRADALVGVTMYMYMPVMRMAGRVSLKVWVQQEYVGTGGVLS